MFVQSDSSWASLRALVPPSPDTQGLCDGKVLDGLRAQQFLSSGLNTDLFLPFFM